MYQCMLRFAVGNIRNLAMEKVATTVMFPCKYSSSGCPVTLLHTDKQEHEETCEYRSSISDTIITNYKSSLSCHVENIS